MKLLLDEMLSADIARQLRRRGHDVVAVTERPELRAAVDADLFAGAQEDGRAVVTRDVVDYLAQDAAFRSAGREHHGLFLIAGATRLRSVGALVAALDLVLEEHSERMTPTSFVHWLTPAR